MRGRAVPLSLAAATLALAATGLPVSASAQAGGTAGPDNATCSAGTIAWNRAKERGPAGRRDALKAVLAAMAAGDTNAGPCLSRKVTQDLTLIASGTSSLQGWAPLLAENRRNIDAAKAQPLKDQCAAIGLFAKGWAQLRIDRPHVPESVGDPLKREQQALCAAG